MALLVINISFLFLFYLSSLLFHTIVLNRLWKLDGSTASVVSSSVDGIYIFLENIIIPQGLTFLIKAFLKFYFHRFTFFYNSMIIGIVPPLVASGTKVFFQAKDPT